ncbi:aspartate kinase, partial [Candidatus Micrarchaeota archaeon]|nr:aspartate kinase [Candidatus Micrarchaeota archaeon]
MRTVMKIGGGILRSSRDLDLLKSILKTNEKRENVLVVSALKGVTDKLLEAYADGKNIVPELRKLHESYLTRKSERLDVAFHELGKLLDLKKKSIERKERIACFGERLSAILIAEYLNFNGMNSVPMDSEECGIINDGKFERANCIMEKTKKNFSKNVVPKIKDNVLVITGFYGLDEKGNVVTFGRGGSDYSAGIVAACTDSDSLEIWKDVEGFMTADPRIVPDAKKLEEISFTEAQELGYSGAKILHPRTIDALEGSNVFVEIRSVLAPEKHGTKIVSHRKADPNKPVTSIAAKKGIVIVDVEGGQMIDIPGVAGSIFSEVAVRGVSIDMITTSQVRIAFTVDSSKLDATKEVLQGMKGRVIEKYSVDPNMAIVSAVGNWGRKIPGIAARV